MKKHYRAKWFIDEYFKDKVEKSLSKEDIAIVMKDTKEGLNSYWEMLNVTDEDTKLELLIIAIIASYAYIETYFEKELKERFGEA